MTTTTNLEPTATVVFRIAGPMQAWPTRPGRAIKSTSDHPTRSGMIGLVANALGWDYHDDLAPLTNAAWAVRADRPGIVETDFHTAGAGTMPLLPGNALDLRLGKIIHAAAKRDQTPILTEGDYVPPRIDLDADGNPAPKPGNAAVLVDEYLADAVFTAAVTCPPALAQRIHTALTCPARLLHLGRRAYPATGQIALDLIDDPATTAAAVLHTYRLDEDHQPGPWRIWADTPIPGADQRHLVADDITGTFADRRHRKRMEWSILTPDPDPTAIDPDHPDETAESGDRVDDLDFFAAAESFTP